MKSRTDSLIERLQLQTKIQQEEIIHLQIRVRQQDKNLAILREQLDLLKARYGQPILRPTMPTTPPPIQDPMPIPTYGPLPTDPVQQLSEDALELLEKSIASDLNPELGR